MWTGFFASITDFQKGPSVKYKKGVTGSILFNRHFLISFLPDLELSGSTKVPKNGFLAGEWVKKTHNFSIAKAT